MYRCHYCIMDQPAGSSASQRLFVFVKSVRDSLAFRRHHIYTACYCCVGNRTNDDNNYTCNSYRKEYCYSGRKSFRTVIMIRTYVKRQRSLSISASVKAQS